VETGALEFPPASEAAEAEEAKGVSTPDPEIGSAAIKGAGGGRMGSSFPSRIPADADVERSMLSSSAARIHKEQVVNRDPRIIRTITRILFMNQVNPLIPFLFGLRHERLKTRPLELNGRPPSPASVQIRRPILPSHRSPPLPDASRWKRAQESIAGSNAWSPFQRPPGRLRQ
jgi:hypothetical protein